MLHYLIKSLISEDYQGAQGNTRQKILLRLALWFKRYETIDLKNTISEIEATPQSARLVLQTTFSQSQAFVQLGLNNNRYQFVLLLSPDEDNWLLDSVSYTLVK